MSNQNDFTLRIGDLVPEGQKLESVKPDDDLSQAMCLMKRKNYSQLPVIESGRLKGVVSWRTIGESAAGSKSPMPKLVRCCMDPCVETTNADRSLFDVIQEIEKRDYIVVEDSCGIKGIVTASDLANRFERFSRAFAYIGEIELRLREFIERKGICIEKPQKPLDGWVLGLPDCIKALKSDQGIKALKHNLDDPKHFICEVRKVNSIRNRVMHFKDGRLDEANDEDLNTLETTLEKIRSLAKT